jgi:large subunit ribosomal protein L19
MSRIMQEVEKKNRTDRTMDFGAGDTILVQMKIQEGDKVRVQPFQGVVIQKRGSGINQSFTVRKASGNIYVERVFPLHSPMISEIKVVRKGQVRRAKLYYLRERTGKSTRIKESA